MEILEITFAFLTVLFAIAIILGLIKPENVIFWTRKKSRGKVWIYYGLAFLFAFIMLKVSKNYPLSETQHDNSIRINENLID